MRVTRRTDGGTILHLDFGYEEPKSAEPMSARDRMIERNRGLWKQDQIVDEATSDPDEARARMLERKRNAWCNGGAF